MTDTLIGTPPDDDPNRVLSYWEARAILVELGYIDD